VTLDISGLTTPLKFAAHTLTSTIVGTLISGTQVINGNSSALVKFVVSPGGTLVSANPNGIINGSAGMFNFSAGTVTLDPAANYIFNGTNPQVTAGLSATVNNLTFSNAMGVTLSAATTINGTLEIDSGVLTTTSSTTPTANAVIAASGSYVSGPLALVYNGAEAQTFPIGKGGNARSVTVNYTSLDNPSTVTVEQFESAMGGTLPANTTQFASRYWTINQTGGSTLTYNLTLDGTGFPPSATALVLQQGSPDTSYGAAYTSPSYTATGLSSFGNFTLGAYVPPGADQLAFTTSPQTLTAGVTSGAITVQLQDSGGNPKTYATNLLVTLSSSSGTGLFRDAGDSTTISSVTIVAGNNSVTFKYRDTAAPATPTLTASTTGGVNLTTQQETVNAGAVSQLVFIGQPGGTNTGATLAPVVVQLEDQYGNLVLQSGTVITLTLTNGGSCILTGTNPQNTAGTGQAVFNDLAVTGFGTGMSLRATSPGLTPAVSSSFNITSLVIVKALNSTALNAGSSWTGGVEPGTNDTAQIDTTSVSTSIHTVDVGDNVSWYGINCVGWSANAGYTVTDTVGGHFITLGAGGVVGTNVTHSITFNNGFVLDSNQTWTWGASAVNNGTLNAVGGIVNGGYNFTLNSIQPIAVSGIISGVGSLTVTGSGAATMSSANTYSGNTVISGGTLALGASGSISNSPLVAVNNGGTFDVSGLALPFAATNQLLLGSDTLGSGRLNLGNTLVTNFNYISLSNAVLQMTVVNPAVANITVTNLNLGDGGAASAINITALPLTVPSQLPLIKYANATGTFNLTTGTLPVGASGYVSNNVANHSVDLVITGLPAGVWNGGSASDNNWSDAANWRGASLGGSDSLSFIGFARLNNTNDTANETAYSINFLAGAGAFALNGNSVTLAGNVLNSSASLETIDLGLKFGISLALNGGSAGLIIGGGLTNTLGSSGYTTLTLAGIGIITNFLNSTTSPGGTNSVAIASGTANWTLVDNSSATATTVPWEFNIAAGTFTFGNAGSAPNLTSTTANSAPLDNYVGNLVGGSAAFNMVNGTFTTVGRFDTAAVNSSTGLVSQVGGTLNIGSQFQGANGEASNEVSIVNLSGGTMNIGGGTGSFFVSSREAGTLTLSNSAVLTCGALDVARNAFGNTIGSVGVVNLNGGTLIASRVGTGTSNPQAGPPTSGINPSATFNFNGGTLKASANSGTFFQGAASIPITAIVTTGGAVVNDGGFAISVLEPLQHDSNLGAAADGGLIKNGSGTLTLTAVGTYTGNTVVNSGTLALTGSGAIANSAAIEIANGATLDVSAVAPFDIAASQTLAGNGSVNGSMQVDGTLSPGLSGIGTLTFTNDLTVNGNLIFGLNKFLAQSNSLVVVSGLLTNTGAGTLTVNNLGPALVAGDKFTLFSQPLTNGNALTLVPPVGVTFTNNLAVDGSIQVLSVSIAANPTNLTATVSGNLLAMSWPQDHLGWIAQSNSVSLANTNYWFDIPNSQNGTNLNITMNPGRTNVFYRLRHP